MTDKQIINKCGFCDDDKYCRVYPVKNILSELQAKEQECEELKEKLQKYKDNEQREIELNKKRADGFKEMQKRLYEKFDGSSLIEKRSPYEN